MADRDGVRPLAQFASARRIPTPDPVSGASYLPAGWWRGTRTKAHNDSHGIATGEAVEGICQQSRAGLGKVSRVDRVQENVGVEKHQLRIWPLREVRIRHVESSIVSPRSKPVRERMGRGLGSSHALTHRSLMFR